MLTPVCGRNSDGCDTLDGNLEDLPFWLRQLWVRGSDSRSQGLPNEDALVEVCLRVAVQSSLDK